MSDPKRIYRFLLNLYPARFREEYSGPLERQFLDEYAETQSRSARAKFLLRAFADLAASIPSQILRETRQDLLYASRIYRQRWLVTGLALGALALAIGATTGVFSVVNALLLRSLPFRAPERLVDIRPSVQSAIDGRAAFHDWSRGAPYLEDAAIYISSDMNLSAGERSVRVKVAETSSNFFRVLGAEPEFGRAFTEKEDIAGEDGVAVIGYGLWQGFFGGDLHAIGSTIRVNGAPLTIVGVASAQVDYPSRTAIWCPTIFNFNHLPKRGAFAWFTVARLKQGVTLAQATSMFTAELRRRRPGRSSGPFAPKLIVLRDQLAGPVKQASLALFGLVTFVLLIACANVAHLLLSRVTQRRRELAIRTALGASRARLVQQLTTESILLTALAAAAGIAVSRWAVQLAAAAQPTELSAQDYTLFDWRVLAFTVVVAIVTGIAFGVLPASLIGRLQNAEDPMRSQAAAPGVNRMRFVLVAMQTVLTVILIAGAATTGHIFLNLLHTDLGFRTDHAIALSVSMTGSSRQTDQRMRQYYHDALDRLRSVPGVEFAGAVDYIPMGKQFLGVLNYKLDSGQEAGAAASRATPGYFQAIGLGLIEGRDFNRSDEPGAEPVAIVNETFVRLLGDGVHAMGRKLRYINGATEYTIVGVVRGTRFHGPEGSDLPQVFFPADQAIPESMTFVARILGNPELYLAVCRAALRSVDPEVPVFNAGTLARTLQEALAQPRFYTSATVFLAAFALLLAIVGVHGMASRSIAERTHEIGVRLAIGATPGRLRAALLRQSLAPVAVGMAAGVCAAIWLGRLMEHFIVSAQPAGIGTCVSAALLLAATAAAVVWVATRRVTRLDPMKVLRAE